MRKKWIAMAVAVVLICLPLVIYGVFRRVTAFPRQIRIATGPTDGLYTVLSKRLAAEIERRSENRISVITVESRGSLDNLRLLIERKVDFAFYQPGTRRSIAQYAPDVLDETGFPKDTNGLGGDVQFIANVFWQPAHFIVRRGAGIKSPKDLIGKRVNLGGIYSGDYAMSLLLLKHFGLSTDSIIRGNCQNYAEIQRAFLDDNLDAAFITMGVHAPIFHQQLFSSGKCDLLEIPNADALTVNHVALSRYTIPRGLYQSQPPEPATDTETVALGAQLLTRSDVHTGLVKEVAGIVLDRDFIKRNQLGELFAQGTEFAQQKPEFTIHSGARSFYDPAFDIHLVESWEAIYSLLTSIFIALFLGFRSWRKRKTRRKESELDHFIRKLLKIEREQVSLDAGRQRGEYDTDRLQVLLDRVTDLRQDALREITAHDLNEDRAADSFVSMCHALSNKINAKISRQRLDQRIDELITSLKPE